MESKDVLISAPPMTPDGTVMLTDAEVRAFNSDFENLKQVASNLATMLCALIVKNSDGSDEVLLDHELLERTKGSQVVMSEDTDGVKAKVTRRAPTLIAVEGRM